MTTLLLSLATAGSRPITIVSTVPHIEHPASPKDSAVARLVSTFGALVGDKDAGDTGLAMPMVIITAGKGWSTVGRGRRGRP